MGGSIAVFWMMVPCFGLGSGCSGGTTLGFLLGVAALTTILISFAYMARKQWARSALFTLEEWLYIHVVIGTLSLELVVAHSGFQLRNTVAVLAFFFLIVTVLSGVAGLLIFYYAPRDQAKRESAVLMPDDLCRRLSVYNEEIAELCKQKGGVFMEVYDEVVFSLYNTRVGTMPESADLAAWSEKVPTGGEEDFIELAVKVEVVHDILILLNQHMRFRWLVRGWLIVHVPATIGLLVFTMVHVVSLTWLGVS